MARKKKRKGNASELSGDGGFDMTPMIDVTFLLIIFFLLITELADVSKAKMKLPRAGRAEPDDKAVPGRVVLNILRNGDVVVMGQKYDDATLDNLLTMEAKISRAGSTDGFPSRAILIRADARTEFENVQHVMAMCMYRQLWRIAFGTADTANPNGM